MPNKDQGFRLVPARAMTPKEREATRIQMREERRQSRHWADREGRPHSILAPETEAARDRCSRHVTRNGRLVVLPPEGHGNAWPGA